MKLLKALAVALLLAVAGCGSPKWDVETIKTNFRKSHDEKIKQVNPTFYCKDVEIIATSDPNVFKGIVTYQDNSNQSITINVEPNTGKIVYQTHN